MMNHIPYGKATPLKALRHQLEALVNIFNKEDTDRFWASGHLLALELMARVYLGYCHALELPRPETLEQGICAIRLFLVHQRGRLPVVPPRDEARSATEVVNSTPAMVLTKSDAPKAYSFRFSSGENIVSHWF